MGTFSEYRVSRVNSWSACQSKSRSRSNTGIRLVRFFCLSQGVTGWRCFGGSIWFVKVVVMCLMTYLLLRIELRGHLHNFNVVKIARGFIIVC